MWHHAGARRTGAHGCILVRMRQEEFGHNAARLTPAGGVCAVPAIAMALVASLAACGVATNVRDASSDGRDSVVADVGRVDAPVDAEVDSSADGPGAVDATAPCATDAECSDGVFCNGVERCTPGATGADARGCASPTAPACPAPQTCDEVMSRCLSCPRIRVTTVGIALNVRDAPRLAGAIVGTLPEGAIASVVSVVVGDTVDGIATWYEVATPRGFVSGRYSECTTDEPPPRPAGFFLPLACGTSARISQGNNSGFSHTGSSAYAFDFALVRGTSLHAMADGVVSYVYNATGPGDPCYDGGGVECVARANIVRLRHADGTFTGYAHLDAVLVSVGTMVRSGTPVGRSGSSGYSTGPHAHVAHENCGSGGCPSIPLMFADVPGSGVPVTGQVVTSGNCP